jgi:hypothetical protein
MVLAAYSGADCDGRPADIAHKPIRRFSEQGRCGDVVSHLRRHRRGYECGRYSLRYVSRRPRSVEAVVVWYCTTAVRVMALTSRQYRARAILKLIGADLIWQLPRRARGSRTGRT